MNVYDFDETIYDGESSIQFILFFIRKDPSILRHMPTVFKAFRLYQNENLSFEDFVGRYSYILTDFCSRNKIDMNKAVCEFWDKHIKNVKPFYRKQQKDNDVIITASPSFMMEDIADRIGINHLICTDFDINTGKIRAACFRERKVGMFFDRFPDAVIDNFYTDSMNDKFLFPYSKKVFIVKKKEILPYYSDEVGSALNK